MAEKQPEKTQEKKTQKKGLDAGKVIIGLGIVGATGFFALKAFAGEGRREPQPGEQYPKAEIVSITYTSDGGKFTATVKVKNVGAARGQFFCEAFLVDADKCPPEWDGNYPVAVDLVRIGEGYRLQENGQNVPFRWLDPGAETPDPFVMSATMSRAGRYHLLIYVDVKNAKGEKIIGTNAGAARENVLEIKEGVKEGPRARLGSRTYEGGSSVLTGVLRRPLAAPLAVAPAVTVAPAITPIQTTKGVYVLPRTGVSVSPGGSVHVTCTIRNVGNADGDFKLIGIVYHESGPAAAGSPGYWNDVANFINANPDAGAYFGSDWARIAAGGSKTFAAVASGMRRAGTYRAYVVAAVKDLGGQRLYQNEDYGYDSNAFTVTQAAAAPKAQLGQRSYY